MVAILMMVFTKNTAPMKRSFIFCVLCEVQIIVIICSMGFLSVMHGKIQAPDIMGTLFADLYFAFDYFGAILFMYYMVLWSGSSIKKNFGARIFFYIPVIVYVLLICDNFIHHNLYTLDMEHGLVATGRLTFLSLVALYSLLYGIVYAIHHVRTISYGKLTIIAIASVVVVIAIMHQFKHPEIMFVNFIVSVFQLILYDLAQNSATILDNNTKLLNRDMMDEILNVDISEKKDFDLLVLAMDDFKLVNKSYGINIGDIVLRQIADFLKTVNPKAKVFRYGSD